MFVDFFPSITLSIFCHSLLASRVLAEKSAVSIMGILLYIIFCFSLVAFNVYSLCFILVSLINVCLGEFLFGVSCMGLSGLPYSYSSVTRSCPTLSDPMDCSTPGLPVHHQLPMFTQTHVHRVGDSIQPSQPLSSPFPPAWIFPSIRVFLNESVLCIRWPKYWSFSFNISPSNGHPGLKDKRDSRGWKWVLRRWRCPGGWRESLKKEGMEA